MTTKLIKLSETHYIIVDDSEIRQGEWFYMYNHFGSVIDRCDDKSPFVAKSARYIWENNGKKITHSFGMELEGVENRSLSEVEEALYGYNLHKLANNFSKNDCGSDLYEGFIKGFNVHKELTKDKIFTVEDMKKAMWEIDRLKTADRSTEEFKILVDGYIKSLFPQKQWNVEFLDGKLKLK